MVYESPFSPPPPPGNAYVTRETISTNFPTTPGAFQSTLGSSRGLDAFVAKIADSLSLPQLTLHLNKLEHLSDGRRHGSDSHRHPVGHVPDGGYLLSHPLSRRNGSFHAEGCDLHEADHALRD